MHDDPDAEMVCFQCSCGSYVTARRGERVTCARCNGTLIASGDDGIQLLALADEARWD